MVVVAERAVAVHGAREGKFALVPTATKDWSQPRANNIRGRLPCVTPSLELGAILTGLTYRYVFLPDPVQILRLIMWLVQAANCTYRLKADCLRTYSPN
jgi:hypothetical protein